MSHSQRMGGFAISLPARAHISAERRADLAMAAVFVAASAFYLWTAATSIPVTFHNGGADRYNLLATAFLHLRLSVGPAPAALLHLAQPYNPAKNTPVINGGTNDATNLHDDVLFHGHLYFVWGPVPALVFLVPMHLLGFEPSGSVTVPFFGIIGLGFALGTLRVLLRRIGAVPLWICVLAASALALCSAVPFLLRTPSVTEDTIAGGFCFTMAGTWLAISAIADRRASLPRLVLMSACFGLAAGSRPTLALTAAVLVPVYLRLRASRPRRSLAAAVFAPVGICLLLLLAYNQARFGDPFELGSRHQLTAYNSLHAPLSSISYVPVGAWFYTLSPPRPLALFPFVSLTPPPISYPSGPPANYSSPEITGGLLPMTPILVFVFALPWIWRRRPTWLGPLALPLLALSAAGAAILILVSYEIFSTTERYEVDFTMPLLLGALAAWLVLCHRTQGRLRRLVRIGGGLLVSWGCLMGFAISFVGYGNYLAVKHPGTWSTLEDLGSPLSTLIARAAGAPVLSEIVAANVTGGVPVTYTSLGTSARKFWLGVGEDARLTIVSPDTRTAALDLVIRHAVALAKNSERRPSAQAVGIALRGSRQPQLDYSVPAGGAVLRIPLRLAPGVNHFSLSPIPNAPLPRTTHVLKTTSVLAVTELLFEERYPSTAEGLS